MKSSKKKNKPKKEDAEVKGQKMKTVMKKCKKTNGKEADKKAKFVYVRAHYRRMPKKKIIPSPADKKCGKRLDKWLHDGSMFDDDDLENEIELEDDTNPEEVASGTNATNVIGGNLNARMGNDMLSAQNKAPQIKETANLEELASGTNAKRVPFGLLQDNNTRMGNSIQNNGIELNDSGFASFCENEESEEEKKKIIIGQQKIKDNLMKEPSGDIKENIKKVIKKEKSVDPICNCGDCLYKHWTIESDDDNY